MMPPAVRDKVYRIIDANFNRSREGLRVCEEVARFAIDSPELTRGIKSIRDAVSGAARRFEKERGPLTAGRDSAGDVGRASKMAGGLSRRSIADVFAANMERAKESLRVLEEFYKLIDMRASRRFSRLRFAAYDIEKKAQGRIVTLERRGRGPRQGT